MLVPRVHVGGITSAVREFHPFKQKVEDYRRLLNALEKGYDRQVLELYMSTYCGEVQVKHAMKRGLITRKQYKELRSELENKYYLC